MTKKDFKAIAHVIRDLPQRAGVAPEAQTLVAAEFARFLETTNPKFNKVLFLQACGSATKVES